MPRWEYRIRTVGYNMIGAFIPGDTAWGFAFQDPDYLDEKGMTDYLDKIGLDGWELVSVMPITGENGETVEWKLFFKRPKE